MYVVENSRWNDDGVIVMVTMMLKITMTMIMTIITVVGMITTNLIDSNKV